MSDTMSDLAVAYPKTVTACHAEIARLERDLAGEDSRRELHRRIRALESELEEAQTSAKSWENQHDEIETELDKLQETIGGDPVLAINVFLDECERVGPLRYDVPQTDRAMRAIVQLHDAVGRNA
ncbi:MAG: hypothetical protein JWL86_813 [Rhizobium sp.]|nr:hypothetical protein [Rhizobium sp.]